MKSKILPVTVLTLTLGATRAQNVQQTLHQVPTY